MFPLISVIIPVYNAGKHLNRCLDSILGQTYRNLQIILVDDGSTDGSGAVCDEYATKDSRIICIHQPNGGVSKARNAGLRVATGDYYQFPDSDDYLEPDTFEYLLSLVEEHHCDAVNFEYFATYPSHEKAHRLSDDKYGLFDTLGAHEVILSGEPFAWNKFFSKKLITEQIDLPGIMFNEEIARGEDSLFAHEAIDRAETVWFDKRPLYHYVQSEQSACRGTFRKSQLTALKLYEAYQPLLEKQPVLRGKLYSTMAHIHITLYCDMCLHGENIEQEKRLVVASFKAHFTETMKCPMSMKEKVKFTLFRLTPKGFMWVHKMIHRL